jgi:hypothetical protein
MWRVWIGFLLSLNDQSIGRSVDRSCLVLQRLEQFEIVQRVGVLQSDPVDVLEKSHKLQI